MKCGRMGLRKQSAEDFGDFRNLEETPRNLEVF